MPPSSRDTEAAGRAVSDDLAVVRHEFIFRILRGDAALDGETVAGEFHFAEASRLPAHVISWP